MDSYRSENDYQLLYMIYQMDEDSLERLLDKYYKYSIKMLRHYLFRNELKLFGNDCLNDAQALIMKAVYAFRNDRNTTFKTFYHSSFYHLIINYRRHYYETMVGNIERRTLSLDSFICDNSHNSFIDLVVNDDITLEGVYTLHKEEYRYVLKKLLLELHPIERRTLLLHQSGYSYRDIAAILHINVRQVEYILTKVRKSKALID